MSIRVKFATSAQKRKLSETAVKRIENDFLSNNIENRKAVLSSAEIPYTEKKTAKARLSACRHYLQPVTVGIAYEINPHCGVFITYAPHALVKRVRLCKILGFESEMKLVVSEIVVAAEIFKPRQFKQKIHVVAPEIDDDERAVFGVYPAFFFEPRCLIVKLYRAVEVADVVIFVNGSEFHFFILKKQLYPDRGFNSIMFSNNIPTLPSNVMCVIILLYRYDNKTQQTASCPIFILESYKMRPSNRKLTKIQPTV